MDLNFTDAEEDFRLEAREWIAENLPDSFNGGRGRSNRAERDKWYKALAARGWLCQSWPEEYGGTGWSLAKQFIFKEEASSAGAPPGDGGVFMLGPMLIEYGTEAQKKRYLPKIASAEEMWCQGYSEPNAGSDLASLALRAERDGDNYILNGQKIWTSGAGESDMIFLLARTDVTAKKKQEGISFLVSPIDAPGIEIRPIRQITDESHFYETFFTDVKVSVENLIGEENAGWTLGKRLLAHERVASGAAVLFGETLKSVRTLAQTVDLNGSKAIEDSEIRQRLAKLHIELDALAALGYRGLTQLLRGEMPGPESSIIKLYGSELFQRMNDLAMDLQGPLGQLWDEETFGDVEGGWPMRSTGSRSYSIFSGTSEVQRNIISERVLGMPRG
jgi:hypothetical protein